MNENDPKDPLAPLTAPAAPALCTPGDPDDDHRVAIRAGKSAARKMARSKGHHLGNWKEVLRSAGSRDTIIVSECKRPGCNATATVMPGDGLCVGGVALKTKCFGYKGA
jgi:hypothetical protein